LPKIYHRNYRYINDSSTALLAKPIPSLLSVAATHQINIMENALFSNVQKLYDNGLYECVIPAVSDDARAQQPTF